MSPTRQIKLGLFIRPSGNHIASWRHPDSHADAGANFQRFVEMAQTAERGLLDMLFSADTQSAWTAEGDGMQCARSHGACRMWRAGWQPCRVWHHPSTLA